MKIQHIKVLLVEDDKNTRSAVRAMLTEMGINQVFESKDGKEADTFMDMDAMEINLVISDWNMPEKTGYEFLKSLRDTKPGVPFIMITGRADINSVQDAQAAGVTTYIRKPFSMKELEARVWSVYKKHIAKS